MCICCCPLQELSDLSRAVEAVQSERPGLEARARAAAATEAEHRAALLRSELEAALAKKLDIRTFLVSSSASAAAAAASKCRH